MHWLNFQDKFVPSLIIFTSMLSCLISLFERSERMRTCHRPKQKNIFFGLTVEGFLYINPYSLIIFSYFPFPPHLPIDLKGYTIILPLRWFSQIL